MSQEAVTWRGLWRRLRNLYQPPIPVCRLCGEPGYKPAFRVADVCEPCFLEVRAKHQIRRLGLPAHKRDEAFRQIEELKRRAIEQYG